MPTPKLLTRLSIALLLITPVLSSQGLKTIDNPGGGQLVYGPMDDQTTPQAAMASVLHLTHTHFGGRPQVSTIFQSKDKQTFGCFFTLTASTQGNKSISGMVLVNMAQGDKPAAAVLYDDTPRFSKTEPALMHTLSTAWRASAAAAPAGSYSNANTHYSAPKQLTMVSGGDRSASIALPEDWHITAVSGGQLTAEGPNGEQLGLGILFQQIHDPRAMNDPRTPAYMKMGAGGGVSYPNPLNGGDLFPAYVAVMNQVLQHNHKPAPTFHFIGETQNPADPQAIQARWEVDFNNGKGPLTASGRIAIVGARGAAIYAMSVNWSGVPKALNEAEKPTIAAILKTYSQDVNVINSQLHTVLKGIEATGERSRQQAADADARRIASTTAFNAHMDDLDRASVRQQNYTMDRTELQDNKYNERGAIDNNVAAALIRLNPDRYQEVPMASFLKGVDY